MFDVTYPHTHICFFLTVPSFDSTPLRFLIFNVSRRVYLHAHSSAYVTDKPFQLTLILRRSRTGTVWFYTSTSNKRAARPKQYTQSLTRDLKLMYSRLTVVRISK